MSKKIWIRTPQTITDKLSQIEELAAEGLNKTQICTSLKMGKNTFGSYKHPNDAFEAGRVALARVVAKSFKKNLTESYSDRVHLSKSLRLFATGFQVGKISDANSAMEALTKAIEVFAEGGLSIDELEVIRKSAATYSDLFAGNMLEKRLEHLEELLTNGKAGIA